MSPNAFSTADELLQDICSTSPDYREQAVAFVSKFADLSQRFLATLVPTGERRVSEYTELSQRIPIIGQFAQVARHRATASNLLSYLRDVSELFRNHDGMYRALNEKYGSRIYGLLSVKCANLTVDGDIDCDSPLFLLHCAFDALDVPALSFRGLQADSISLSGAKFRSDRTTFGADGSLHLTKVTARYLNLRGIRARKLSVSECEIENVDICDALIADAFFRQNKIGAIRASGMEVMSDADFRSNEIREEAYFEKTRFEGWLDFSGSSFNGPTSFANAQFKRPPKCHGTTFSSNTTFRRARFEKESWKERMRKLDERGHSTRSLGTFESGTDGLQQEAERLAFRTLRTAMRKAGEQQEELRFAVFEHRAERDNMEWLHEPITKGLSYGYDLASRYGTSPGQAFLALVGWNVIFGGLLAALVVASPWLRSQQVPLGFGYVLGLPNMPAPITVSPGSVFEGVEPVGLTLQNAVNPLALFSERPVVRVQAGSLVVFSLVQSAGSLGIFTLVLLAVRNRFARSGGGRDTG